MNKLEQLNALIQAKSLTQILIIHTNDNNKHFTTCVRMGSYAIAYGTFIQTEAFIKGFRQGLTESKQLKAYDIHF
jgi:ssDNA-specific exonuclease RecJ